jgi:hypothetical protein
VGWVDQCLVRQGKEFVVQGVIEHASELCGTGSTGSHEIRTANIADEQCVTRQDSMRSAGILRQVVDHNGDAFRRVAWRFEHHEADVTERQRLTIMEWCKGVVGLRLCPQADGRSRPFIQFQMPSQKIGVEVRQEHVSDVQPMCSSVRQILLDVPLRVNHHGGASRLVGNEVRSVRQAAKVILLQ